MAWARDSSLALASPSWASRTMSKVTLHASFVTPDIDVQTRAISESLALADLDDPGGTFIDGFD